MFEQLVRPFQSRQILTTRRVVPVKVDDTPGEAKIAWGNVGSLPKEVVQPKGVNIENIMDVGFNIRGNIDNWHQSSREPEYVDVPIKDADGNEIGSVTLDRAKQIGYDKKVDPYDWEKNPSAGYFPNFHGVARPPPAPSMTFVGTKRDAEAVALEQLGIRASIPGADTDRSLYQFTYRP